MWTLEVNLKDFNKVDTWKIGDQSLSLDCFKDLTGALKVYVFPDTSAYFMYAQRYKAQEAQITYLTHLAAVGTGKPPFSSIKRTS